MLPDEFLEKVLVFVDRNGRITSKRSTPMSCSLEMSYESNGLTVNMHAYVHGMGNGSCGAEVTFNGALVYKAGGHFTTRPFGVKVETYQPGEWEQLMALRETT